MNKLIWIIVFAFIGASSALEDQCYKCANGDCSSAFRGGAAQWCGSWTNGTTTVDCCCPIDAICGNTIDLECRCEPSDVSDDGSKSDIDNAEYIYAWVGVGMGLTMAMLVCGAACHDNCCKKKNVPFALTPEAVPTVYVRNK